MFQQSPTLVWMKITAFDSNIFWILDIFCIYMLFI